MSDDLIDALGKAIEDRRRDPEFRQRLERNMDKHKKLLDRLADEGDD